MITQLSPHSFVRNKHGFCTMLFLSYRPLEVDGEPDGVVVCHVVAQDGRDKLSERALVRGVDVGLVVLEAHPELCGAPARALAARRPVALAAVALSVLAVKVQEALQLKLEHALAVCGNLEKKNDIIFAFFFSLES